MSTLYSVLVTYFPTDLVLLLLSYLRFCPCSFHPNGTLHWIDKKNGLTRRCGFCKAFFCSSVCHAKHLSPCALPCSSLVCPENACSLCKRKVCDECGSQCDSCDFYFHNACIKVRHPRLDSICESSTSIQIDTDCWHCGVNPQCQKPFSLCVICKERKQQCERRRRKCLRCGVPLCVSYLEFFDTPCLREHLEQEKCMGVMPAYNVATKHHSLWLDRRIECIRSSPYRIFFY